MKSTGDEIIDLATAYDQLDGAELEHLVENLGYEGVAEIMRRMSMSLISQREKNESNA